MPEEPAGQLRSKALDLLAWAGVLLVWALFLLALALWWMAGWFRGFAGRRRFRRLAFLLPLLLVSIAGWKLGPVLWGRFLLLDRAAIAARRSDGVEPAQVAAKLRLEAMRLGLSDIQQQDGAIEVEKFEEDGLRRCRVCVGFTQNVRLLRWTWALPVRGTVEETIRPKPANPWSDENLVR